MTNPCTAEPWYWQNHVNYILVRNASLLLCEELSVATILSVVKYSISPLNSSNVLPVVLCWFHYVHFEIWNIYCWKINAKNIATEKVSVYKHCLRSITVLRVCRPTLKHANVIAEIRQAIFLCNILVSHTDFNKSQATFQAVQGKTGLTLSEEYWWKSEELYYPPCWGASGPLLLHRGLATRRF